MVDVGLVAARGSQGELQRVGDVGGLHRRAQLPGDDVPRKVVEDRRQVHPAPADDLEVGEVGLPHLVGRTGLVGKLAGCLDDDERRTGDQVVRLEQATDRRFRDEVAALVGEAHRQLAWGQFGLFERHLDERGPHIVRDAVPHPARLRWSIFQSFGTAGLIAVVTCGRRWRGRCRSAPALPSRAGSIARRTG